ncbi:hypothetical protein ACWD6P_28125 [Streptomyces sp. NPDC002446]
MVYALILLVTLVGVIAVVLLGFSDLVGTRDQHRRRQADIIRSFDGRPEVKVRVNGTGWSAEQTAWLGHQYGYSVWQWETNRGQPRYLVMRRTAPTPPNTGASPGNWNAAPQPASVEQIQNELRQAPDPAARRTQIIGLLVFGIGSVIAAVSNYRSGDPYLAPAIAAPAFLGGAAALTWYTRRADRRRTLPPPGRQKW